MKRLMKKLGITAGLLILPLASAWAEPEIYGRANVSFELVDEAGDSGTALQSNSSRLGFKGSELINDQLELVYQLEYGVNFDDGDSNGDTFSQRNIFVGVQSDWGRVIAGHFDTPLKSAQGKLDLFNDLRGDITRTFTTNENRMSNSVMYTTPDALGPFTANVAYISSEDDTRSDGKSASLTYGAGDIYAAIAVDQDVEQEDGNALRMVGIYNLNAWQFGAMIETVDNTVSVDRTEGLLLSAKYQTGAWALKAQAGQSDIIAEGTETLSLGADYTLSKAAMVYGFFTFAESDQPLIGDPILDGTYLGAGIQLKF